MGYNSSLHFIFIPTKYISLILVMSTPGGIDQKCLNKNIIKKLMLKVQLNILSNTELTFLLFSVSVCHKMHFPGTAILKFKMAAINENFQLGIYPKILRIDLSVIVPNFMLLSKSAQLFHISALLLEKMIFTGI